MEEKRSGIWLFTWDGGEGDRCALIKGKDKKQAIENFRKWWEDTFEDSHWRGLQYLNCSFGEFDEDNYLTEYDMESIE